MNLNELIIELQKLQHKGMGKMQVVIGDEDEMTVKTIKPSVSIQTYLHAPQFNGVYIETDAKVRN